MKKHDEGYVLAFVMVVITVLCLIAVLLMPLSLRNLEAQNDSIRRMQDKYAAQGVIETVVAKMNSAIEIEKLDDLETDLGAGLNEETTVSINFSEESTEDTFDAEVIIASESGSTKVTATLSWTAVGDEENGKYLITTRELRYVAYLISFGEGAADE